METTETCSSIESLKLAIAKVGKVMFTYTDCGASDTEPDAVFQCVLAKAVRGDKPTVPTTVREWQLFSCMTRSRNAAVALSKATQQCVDIIENAPREDRNALYKYLTDYCWRVCF